MLARKSLLTVLTNVVGAVFGLAGVLAIGRFMGKEPLGYLAYTLGLGGLAVFVSRLGFDSAHIKRVSEGQDLGKCIGTYGTIKLALSGAFVAVAVAAALAWDHFFGFYDTSLAVVLLVLGYYVAQTLRGLAEFTFTGLRMIASLQAMVLVEHVAKLPVVIVAAALYGQVSGDYVPLGDLWRWLADRLSIDGPVGATRGAAWLALAWMVAMLASVLFGLGQMARHGMRPTGYDAELARSYWAFAMPLALVSALNMIQLQLDSVMIGFFWSAADVGDYFAAQRLASVLLILPLALRSVFFPTVSGLASRGEHAAVRDLALQTQRHMSMIMVLATMFLVMYAADGLHVFVADEFVTAAPVLQLMALATLVLGLVQVAQGILTGYDEPRWVARIGVVAVAVNLTLNTVFIPDSFFGIPMLGLRAPGAALATLVAYVLLLAMALFAAKRRTGAWYLDASTLKHLVAAVATAGVLHLLDGTALIDHADRWWELAVAGVVGTAAYALLLLVLRELGRKDLDFYVDLVDPGKMARYVRDELVRKKRS